MTAETDPGTETGDRNFEEEAGHDGWVTQDEWKGDPAKWVNAKTFVERGEQFLPIVNAKLRKERERTEKLERDVAELREGNRAFREFSEQALARERTERERAVQQLEEQRAQAITDGDGQRAVALEREIREAGRQPVAKSNGMDVELAQWQADNPWYNTEPTMRAIADGLSDLVAAENPGLKGRSFLDKLTEKVRKEIPHRFPDQPRTVPLGEENRRKLETKSKTFENLPPQAKAAFVQFERTIPGYTKEQYLAQYDWSAST